MCWGGGGRGLLTRPSAGTELALKAVLGRGWGWGLTRASARTERWGLLGEGVGGGTRVNSVERVLGLS